MSINARPRPGDAPFITVSAWALVREASADACRSTGQRAEEAVNKLAARKTCYIQCSDPVSVCF